MIAYLSFGRGCVNRLGQLFGFLQSFRKLYSAYRAVFYIAGPAAAGYITADDALDRKSVV